jgi:hypothetical protein
MASVAELPEQAAEFDRLAAEAKKPSQQQYNAVMARTFRFLADQQAMVDEQMRSTKLASKRSFPRQRAHNLTEQASPSSVSAPADASPARLQ